jgi:AcrR family transcriptional regulator
MPKPSARRSRGRPPGPGVDPDSRRDELLAAAESEIEEHGSEFGLAGVAKRAGLTRSAVYAAFANRDDLLAALTRRHADLITVDMAGVLNDVEGPLMQTRATVDLLARWMEDNPELSAVLAPRMQAGVGDSLVTGFLEHVLDVGLVQVEGNRRAAAPWARAVVGAIWTAVQWWSETRTMDRAELVDHVTDLIWEGFAGVGAAAVVLPDFDPPERDGDLGV